MAVTKMPKEQKDHIVRLVQEYFQEERDEEISSLQAELLVDFMMKQLGPYFYNQAIQDAIRSVNEKMVSLEDDLYSMEKPIR